MLHHTGHLARRAQNREATTVVVPNLMSPPTLHIETSCRARERDDGVAVSNPHVVKSRPGDDKYVSLVGLSSTDWYMVANHSICDRY